jgi:hypothetical protein
MQTRPPPAHRAHTLTLGGQQAAKGDPSCPLAHAFLYTGIFFIHARIHTRIHSHTHACTHARMYTRTRAHVQAH